MPRTARWRPYYEALTFARSLGLANRTAWEAWARMPARPRDIPCRPDQVYHEEWFGWSHWLGQAPSSRHRRHAISKTATRKHVSGATAVSPPLRHTPAARDRTAAGRSLAATTPLPLYRDPGGVTWRYWYVVQYLVAKGSLQRRSWRPFEEARAFVHTLGLPSSKAWSAWCKSGARPHDIPATPHSVYKQKGWVSWGDWLGTNTIWNVGRTYRSFEEARAVVHTLGLSGAADWRAWCKSGARPLDIPAKPARVYRFEGWLSWGDWFGTGTIAPYLRTYRPFAEARAFVHTLGLSNKDDWQVWSKSAAFPPDIPAGPERVYKDEGWVSWGDWLGTGRLSNRYRTYRSFGEARAVARSLGLSTQSNWEWWCRTAARPPDVPLHPERVYKDAGWAGWSDWLNVGAVAKPRRSYEEKPPAYRPFNAARALARALGLDSRSAWLAWCRTALRPSDIPLHPERVYKDAGWAGWSDWLNAGAVVTPRTYRPFAEARAFARTLGQRSHRAWTTWCKTGARPHDIPAKPHVIYQDEGWLSWGDWLGTDTVAPYYRVFRPFEEARAFTHSLGLHSQSAWRVWVKTPHKPGDIPADPRRVYKDEGWVNWGDWLGTGRVATKNRAFRPFVEARAFARTLGLRDKAAWLAWSRSGYRPPDIPAKPFVVYKDDGWTGWDDWLGRAGT